MASNPEPRVRFLPDLCGLRNLLTLVVSAELLALLVTIAAGRPAAGFWHDLSLISLYIQWIALLSAGLLCLLRRLAPRLPERWAAVAVLATLLATTAAAALLAPRALGPAALARLLGDEGGIGLLWRSLGVAAAVGLVLVRDLLLRARARRQALAEGEARLAALQARIRPHFLFNSMNTIASLTRSDPRMAESLVEDLADLFRSSLADPLRMVPLADELESARRYLHIEQQRLGDRLRVEWRLDGLPDDARLPPLTLQPLLENAVYHGVEPATGPGVIRLSGLYRRGRVNLSIRNSLPEGDAGGHRQGNRIALDNIRQRLAACFDEAASLTQGRVEGEYQVRIVVPHPWSADEYPDR